MIRVAGVDRRTTVRIVYEQSFVAQTFDLTRKESMMQASYTATVPHALMVSRPTHATYVRRRIGTVTFFVTLSLSLGLMAQHGLADRGGDPASVPTAGRTTALRLASGLAGAQYLVQSGDTMWSIAESLYRGSDLSSYVDALISLNGGTSLFVGDVLRLP